MEELHEVLLKFEDPEELELFIEYMTNTNDTEVDSENNIIIIKDKNGITEN